MDKVISISYSAINFRKGMYPTILPPAMDD